LLIIIVLNIIQIRDVLFFIYYNMKNNRPTHIKNILMYFSLLHTPEEEVAMRKGLFALMSDAEIEEFAKNLEHETKKMQKITS